LDLSLLKARAAAKVLGRFAASEGDVEGFWGILATRFEGAGSPNATNGFGGFLEEEVEKGFTEELVENGFAEAGFDEGLAPNNCSPMLITGFGTAASSFLMSVVFPSLLFGGAISEIRTPRNTFTLPSFRLQVFRRQVKTYNLLSCPGKTAGRSPFNCKSRTMRSLHTLHFARVAEGGAKGSSQVFGSTRFQNKNLKDAIAGQVSGAGGRRY